MKFYRLVSLFFLGTVVACGPVSEGVEAPASYSIEVRILNEVSREPVSNVSVTGVDLTEKTGERGAWAGELKAGDYEVTLTADDFEPRTLTLSLPGEVPEEILLAPLAPELAGLSVEAAGGGEQVTLTGRRFQSKAFAG